MSHTFKGFGEAARLYAANKPVVDAMNAAFEQDVEAFFDAVSAEVRSLSRLRVEDVASEDSEGRWRSWWIPPKASDSETAVSYVFTSIVDTALVVERKLTLWVETDRSDAPLKERLAAEVSTLQLPRHCVPESSRRFPGVVVRLGRGDVSDAARAVWMLLEACERARRWVASRNGTGRGVKKRK